MIEATSDLVNLKKFPTLEEANRAAGLEAGNTGALSIPVVGFLLFFVRMREKKA